MQDTRRTSRDNEDLKSNVLPFPALTYAPPDPRKPSAFRGLLTLIVIIIAVGLICLTGWSLIAQ